MTTVISKGSHFVGGRTQTARTAHLNRRDVISFDSEEELEWASDELDRSEARKTESWDQFKAYIHHYAGQRGQELREHRLRPHFSACPDCGNCLCGKTLPGAWAKCLCAEGKKTLSPYRIVWINNSKKRAWQTSVWEIGTGVVARRHSVSATSMNARGLDGLNIPGASR